MTPRNNSDAHNGSIFYFVSFVFFIKILFAILALTHIYLTHTGKGDSELNETVVYWKERCEFIFIACMSLLLLYFFNPRKNTAIEPTFELRLLFFVFGIIILIRANWKIFFEESKFFGTFQKII
jgi:hypothetical protein